jgi:hypothetical protein
MPSFTRRSLLVGLAATSTSVSVPFAEATPDPDSALANLMRAFEQARTAYETAQRHYNDCEGCYLLSKCRVGKGAKRRAHRP